MKSEFGNENVSTISVEGISFIGADIRTKTAGVYRAIIISMLGRVGMDEQDAYAAGYYMTRAYNSLTETYFAVYKING